MRDGRIGSLTWTSASGAVAHCTTIAETSSKDVALINTQLVENLVKNGVGEGNILSVVVGPSSIQPVGGNEDGRVLGPRLETVVTTANNVAHVTIQPVVADDELVGSVGVVVAWESQGVLAVLAVDVDALNTARGRVLAASCRTGFSQRDADSADEGEDGREVGPHVFVGEYESLRLDVIGSSVVAGYCSWLTRSMQIQADHFLLYTFPLDFSGPSTEHAKTLSSFSFPNNSPSLLLILVYTTFLACRRVVEIKVVSLVVAKRGPILVNFAHMEPYGPRCCHSFCPLIMLKRESLGLPWTILFVRQVCLSSHLIYCQFVPLSY